MRFLDTTLRDGNQAIRENIRPISDQHDRFVRYARAASTFGIDYIEAGIPKAGPFYERTVRDIADAHAEEPSSTILAFSRAKPEEIDQALDCVRAAARSGLALLTSVSDVQLQKFGANGGSDVRESRLRMLEIFSHSVAHASAQKPDELLVYLEDSTRADKKYLTDLCGAFIENGATIISVPDTVGHVNDPDDYADLIQHLRENTAGSECVRWSAHCHNDRGLAVAMCLAAMKRRLVDVVEGTINGAGERTGNTNLTTLFGNIYAGGTSVYPDHYRSEGTLRLSALADLHALGDETLGTSSSPYEPVVGKFAHRTAAGMHQDGALKNPNMFRSYDPAPFGVTIDPFVFSDQSGRKGFAAMLERRGIVLENEALDAAFADAKKMATLVQGRVPDSLLEATAWQATHREQALAIDAVSIENGDSRDVRVHGQLTIGDESVPFSGHGDGATSAFVAGLSDVLHDRFGIKADIDRWFECADTDAGDLEKKREATVWAFTTLKVNGDTMDSYAADPNATHASFLACLQAVNRWLDRTPETPLALESATLG